MTIIAGFLTLFLALSVGMIVWRRRGPLAAVGAALAALLLGTGAYVLTVAFHLG